MRAFRTMALAGWGLLAAAPASAQGLADRVRALQSDEAEAELPDIDAIERGARSRASVSFKGPTVQTAPADGSRPSATARIEGTASGLVPPGGLYGVDSPEIGDPEPRAASIPEHHTIQKGDTLWSLCAYYYGDPQCWPKLWASNPLVTNPHWLFPGDVLRLRAPEASAIPPQAKGVAGPRITGGRASAPGNGAVVLRELGFIEAGALAVSAVITGSREEKIMLATGDQAYVGFAPDRPLRAGERYSVFAADTANPVRDPATGRLLGYMVRIHGDLVVDQIAERNTARGTLVDLVDPVERGFKVSPAVRQFRRIEPRPSAVTLEARVVAAFSPARMLAPETFVVLSRGKKHGLEVGNRSFIVRRGDGHRRLLEDWDATDPRFPKEVVGELWIVDVRDDAAVAWLARSTKEIRVGEVVETRRGH